MNRPVFPEELLEFPCDHVFKAFGPNEPEFPEAVRRAVVRTVPVSLDAMKVRHSSGGKYLAVSVVVRLHNVMQMEEIYRSLRRVEGLKYLL